MREVWKPAWVLALALAGPVRAGSAAEAPSGGDVVERPDKREVTSVTQTLQDDSGVAVQTVCTNCNNADLSVGGLGNEHVTMTCDGVPVPPGLAQVYLLSVLPPTVIDKVSVTRGPGEAELDGGSVGGGIEIERRRPRPGFALHASTDAGGWDWRGSRVDASGKTGWVGGSIVASIAESDAVDANGDGSNELPTFDRTTLDLGLDLDVGRRDRLRFGYATYDESQEGGHAAPIFGLSPTFQFTFQGYGQEFVELDRQQYDALYEHSLASGARLTAEGMFAKRAQDVRETLDSSGRILPTFFIDEDHSHGSLVWDQPVGRTTWHFGGSTTRRAFEIVETTYGSTSPVTRLHEETIAERGLWISAETTLGGSVELDTGLRWVDVGYDYRRRRLPSLIEDEPEAWRKIPLPDGNRLLPRAALTWKPADPVRIRLSVGAGFRAPEPVHEEVCCGHSYRNNRGIATEKSWAAGVETIYQPSPRFKLTGSAFVTLFDDLVAKMVSRSDLLHLVYQNVNVEDARYVTLGFETRYEATSWLAIKAAASWLDAENMTEEDAIVALIDAGSFPLERTLHVDRIPFLAERRGSVGLSLAPPRSRLTFDVNAQYTGEMVIQEFDETTPDGPFGAYGDSLAFVESKDFWVGNASVSAELPAGVSVFFGVDNFNDYVQEDLGDPHFDHKWGPQRGRYVYGGLRYGFATR